MNKIKIIFLFSLILFGKTDFMGQNNIDEKIMTLKKQYSVPKLSKAEMYADFDTLVSIIKRCNPQYLVRKEVTGYDMIAEMNAQRGLIKKCNTTRKFIKLLRNILFLTLDEHCDIGSNIWYYSYSIYANDVKVNKITDREYGINFHYRDDIFYQWPSEINLIYVQGKYFLKNKAVFYSKSDSLVLPFGTEIISYNNQPIDIYLDSVKTIGSRWDFDRKKYYNCTLYINNHKNSIGYLKDNIRKEFLFADFTQEEKEWNSSQEFLLHWFDKDSILYFRIPMMQTINIPEMMKFKELFPEAILPEWKLHFEENVLSYGSKPIKSIIIDVRGSGWNFLRWIEGEVTKEKIIEAHKKNEGKKRWSKLFE